MGKPVICEHCLTEITDKRDLVTASYFIFIVPYHAYCYSQGLKGVKTFILNNYPLNGVSGNFSAITAFIAIIISLIIIPGTVKYLAIIPSVPVIARLLSYILSKTGEKTPTSSA